MKLSELVLLAKGEDPEVLLLEESDDGFDWIAYKAKASLVKGRLVILSPGRKEAVFQGFGVGEFPKGLKEVKAR